MYKLPRGLKQVQRDELKTIDNFFEKEVAKCLYQKHRTKARIKEREEEEKRQAILEQKAQDDYGRNSSDNMEEIEREME